MRVGSLPYFHGVGVIARMSRPRRAPTVHASDFAEECTLHARITRRTARAAWRRHPRQRLGRSPSDCSLHASGYRRQTLFKGLPHGRCPAPHWGYVIKGQIRIIDADREEVLRAGDLYYLPSGHTAVVEETSKAWSSAHQRRTNRFWTSSSATLPRCRRCQLSDHQLSARCAA